jgi:hypothetical protein
LTEILSKITEFIDELNAGLVSNVATCAAAPPLFGMISIVVLETIAKLTLA